MSYILSALQKAEAQRRGEARPPALAQGSTGSPDGMERPGKGGWAGIGAGLLMLMCAVFLWWFLSGHGDDTGAALARNEQTRGGSPATLDDQPDGRAEVANRTDGTTAEPVEVPPGVDSTEPRALPAINVTGYIYFRSNPDNSKLFVDGIVYRKGSRIAEGLTVESFHPDYVTLSYRGQVRRLPVN